MTIQSFSDFERDTKEIVSPFRSRFGARWFHEISGKKPQRDWQVWGLILARAFGIIYGPPGCGKSFLVSDLMLHCAASCLSKEAVEWFGYRVKPFGVVYVVAEGSDDFEIRLEAWRRHHGIADDAVLPFVFLPTSIDLRSSEADALKLIEEIKEISDLMMARCGVPVGCIVIDTVARALSGGNENDSMVMGSFIINCGKLQEAAGVTVLGVHHGGKEAGRGPRGHEALHGAADFEIEVTGATAETPNLWTVRKLKAGPGGAVHKFRLRQTTLDEDEIGRPITSCIVVNQKQSDERKDAAQAGFKVRDAEREFLTIMADVIEKQGFPPPPDLQVPSKVILVASMADVRSAYWDKLSATETGEEGEIEERLRSRWSRATKGLIRFNIIGAKKPWLWFTGREVRDFRIRGIMSSAPTHVQAPGDQREGGDERHEEDFSSYLPGGQT